MQLFKLSERAIFIRYVDARIRLHLFLRNGEQEYQFGTVKLDRTVSRAMLSYI